MARKGWSQLAESTRNRYERAGVTRGYYEGGGSLREARGHAPLVTPERTFTDTDIAKLARNAEGLDFGRYSERKRGMVDMTPGQVIRAALRGGMSVEQITQAIAERQANKGNKAAGKAAYDARPADVPKTALSLYFYH